MPDYKDMDKYERKAFDAAYGSFYLGGNYRVSVNGHDHVVFADSIRWLARTILATFGEAIRTDENVHILVQSLAA